MFVAGLFDTAYLVVTGVLALWAISWLIKGSLTNVGERDAEVQARERIAQGGAWAEDELPPRALTDGEIDDLSGALRPSTLEEAGIDARPRATAPSRRLRRR